MDEALEAAARKAIIEINFSVLPHLDNQVWEYLNVGFWSARM